MRLAADECRQKGWIAPVTATLLLRGQESAIVAQQHALRPQNGVRLNRYRLNGCVRSMERQGTRNDSHVPDGTS